MIVVSNDGFNETPSWRSGIVVPVTTSEVQGARGPTAARLPRGTGGITKDSVALCHQVTTLDRDKLVQRLGSLSGEQLALVEEGLRAALDIDWAGAQRDFTPGPARFGAAGFLVVLAGRGRFVLLSDRRREDHRWKGTRIRARTRARSTTTRTSWPRSATPPWSV